MNQIRDWSGVEQNGSTIEKCMSLQQLKQLAENKMFTIGAHTKSHPALSYHSKAVQSEEIDSNKYFLESELHLPINYFAYPSGNFNALTIDVMKELGFKAAFTTNPQPVKGKTDVFRINRFQVNNWNAEKFENKLNQWFKM